MKIKFLLLVAAVAALAACGDKTEEPEVAPAEELALESVEQRLSYMVGNNMAKQFTRDELTIDIVAMTAGINDILEGKEPRLTDEQIQETIASLQERAQQRQQAEQEEQQQALAEAAEKNKADGDAYLAANKDKEGVVVTDSGLQYRELTAGDGAKPGANDTVTVHYKGTLIDGTEFDSSYGRGEPATFPVQGVIPGWVEALQLMDVGDKWELVIPSDLAYGPGGTGGAIGPNATLIFEVELLDVVEPEAQADISE